jgi:hypothetical protein
VSEIAQVPTARPGPVRAHDVHSPCDEVADRPPLPDEMGGLCASPVAVSSGVSQTQRPVSWARALANSQRRRQIRPAWPTREDSSPRMRFYW